MLKLTFSSILSSKVKEFDKLSKCKTSILNLALGRRKE